MKDKKIAVFFDCENISSSYISDIFDELSKYGEIIIRQSFKDWEVSNNKSWDRKLHEEFAIEPIQVFSKKDKNSSDLRIQRAVLETINQKENIVDIISLVSSDSDFGDLIISVKAKGFESIGFGESKTPASLKNAYSTFIELPIKKEYEQKNNDNIIKLLKEAIEETKKEEGYALVAEVGSYLKRKNSSYIAKNYGAKSWGEILKQHSNIFEISHLGKKGSTLIVNLISKK